MDESNDPLGRTHIDDSTEIHVRIRIVISRP